MDLKSAKFYAIDIETTGLDSTKDEIISFACVPMVNLKILVKDTYYTLIKPKSYNHKSMRYHGIGKADLEAAPEFADVAGRILDILDGPLVGHTVEFDFAFLKAKFRALGIRFKRDIIDIAMIERWLMLKRKTEERHLTLDDMIAAYGLKPHYRHNAAADAFFAAQIFQMQLREMSCLGVDSVRKVVKAAKSRPQINNGFAF